jgi:hypothetical protein
MKQNRLPTFILQINVEQNNEHREASANSSYQREFYKI